MSGPTLVTETCPCGAKHEQTAVGRYQYVSMSSLDEWRRAHAEHLQLPAAPDEPRRRPRPRLPRASLRVRRLPTAPRRAQPAEKPTIRLEHVTCRVWGCPAEFLAPTREEAIALEARHSYTEHRRD